MPTKPGPAQKDYISEAPFIPNSSNTTKPKHRGYNKSPICGKSVLPDSTTTTIMKFAAVMISCVAVAAAAPSYSGCTSGQGKKDYDQGYKMEQSSFKTSWGYLKKNCAKLEDLVTIMDTSAPTTPPCKTLGYGDALMKDYSSAQTKCFDDCSGSGKATGESLGMQFCAITGLNAVRGYSAPPPPTVAICNAIEVDKCKSQYASYINRACPGAKADPKNKQFYEDLKRTCHIV